MIDNTVVVVQVCLEEVLLWYRRI